MINKKTVPGKYAALEEEEEKKHRLEEKLKSLKEKEIEREAEKSAILLKMPYIKLKGFPIDKEALSLISEKEAREGKAIPFYKKGNSVRLGVVDPSNPKLSPIVQFLKNEGFDIIFYIISEVSLKYALNFYKQIIVPKKSIEKVEITKESLAKAKAGIKNLIDLKKKLRTVSITEGISMILVGAVTGNASDIHIEPAEENVHLRYRIDGVLHNVAVIPTSIYPKILSRIKFLAGLKMNITDVPQDGRFTISLEDKDIDLRVSTLPAAYGESIVMRLLGRGAIGLDMNQLGIRERELDILKKAVKRPTGMILTTGPTGSGKTTTLYSLLKYINTPEIKIITLEDPVEYRLEGISQTQINPEAGMTFAKGLRAILRQDPDVVMIGEIRDLETAEIASQAALTGHIVFSTLHTNDSAGVIPRLINIGVRPYIIAPALRVVIAQRLVRRLCKNCREEYIPNKDLTKRLKEELANFYPKEGIKKLYKAKGCPECNQIGYKGRIGIYEVFKVDETIEDLINKRAPALEISKAAIKQGMMTMRQDGLLKAIEGITSIEEVDRVI